MSKDFDDFVKSLSKEELEEIGNSANNKDIVITLPITEETINKFITGISTANLIIAFALLRKYHDWLNS
ncbi:hypothetical protein [Clostridium cellulovorans]|jgi:hypothetical protein|uniref:Uncharacterized protein n=1 Tax=Clostridium cellulovorans (strain ATCC 35296 / DSM 3052 / OCM 3 / 743B) TaxID=573061 RepID=D9SWH4_CLOC7|nr:hypothetical protein [Clostridium cellulovorans]ADL53256.1 hypothetical protein Clocel_3581 [Clostridium cellulovorans 743B]